MHLIANTAVSKNKHLLQCILFKDNREEIEMPVAMWNARYNYLYLVSRSVETEDGLIMPGYRNETVIFVKMIMGD